MTTVALMEVASDVVTIVLGLWGIAQWQVGPCAGARTPPRKR